MQILAAILRSPWMLCALFLLLAGAVNAQNDLLLNPIKGEAQQPGNRIISLRSSQTKGKVRLVVETANTPDYQVYQQNDHLLLELFDTAGGQVQPDKIRDHSFIRSWEVSNPALGLFRWDIKCLYPIPAEQCRIEVLDDPHRLVVDIYTQWIEDETYQLTPGVIWNKRQYFGKICPYLLWNQITFDPKDEHLTLDIALGEDRLGKCEAVSSIVSRKNALVGINGGYFNMSGGRMPAELVRERFQKLNSHHIQYVFECMKKSRSEIHNIKQYLLAALFNAPATMDTYYRARVNHDWDFVTVS